MSINPKVLCWCGINIYVFCYLSGFFFHCCKRNLGLSKTSGRRAIIFIILRSVARPLWIDLPQDKSEAAQPRGSFCKWMLAAIPKEDGRVAVGNGHSRPSTTVYG